MKPWMTWAFAFGLSAYFVRQILRDARTQRAVKQMVPDVFGNYDIDGVSYDPLEKTVVVSGDDRVRDPAEHRLDAKEITALHGKEPSQESVA